jgi:hypothetical protein
VAGYAYALFLHAQTRRSGAGAWIRWLTTVDASRFVLAARSGWPCAWWWS